MEPAITRPRPDFRKKSKHALIRYAVFEMFHPATVDQISEFMHRQGIRIGDSSILRVIRRLVRRGIITAFLERDPPEYMHLIDSTKRRDVRRVA